MILPLKFPMIVSLTIADPYFSQLTLLEARKEIFPHLFHLKIKFLLRNTDWKQ